MLGDISLSSCCCSYVWVIRQPLHGPGLLARPCRPETHRDSSLVLCKVCHVSSVDWSAQQLVERTSHTCAGAPVRERQWAQLCSATRKKSWHAFHSGLVLSPIQGSLQVLNWMKHFIWCVVTAVTAHLWSRKYTHHMVTVRKHMLYGKLAMCFFFPLSFWKP